MDKSDTYRSLRFERRSWSVFRRLIPIGLTFAVFTLLWLLIPSGILYWLLLLPLAALIWIASYGWRRALAALHDLLHRISEI